MDDGSLGHHEDQEDRVLFSVCDFTEEECTILINGLKKFDINAIYYISGGYSMLRLNAIDAEKLFLLIAPYIPSIMQYKLPARYRGHNGWLPNYEVFKPPLISQTITKIDDVTNKIRSMRYDIETETHNYFAGDILVHNSNARFAFRNNQMFCGSRNFWKKEDPQNLWWRALANHPEIQEFCESHQDITVYGEVYGPVQKLRYGLREPKIAVFDLLKENKWINSLDARELGANLPWVPLLYKGPYKFVTVIQLAEQDSSIESAPKGHTREGVVVKPIIERYDAEIGRVNLKIVSNRYLGNE
jgi:hypothetical protein